MAGQTIQIKTASGKQFSAYLATPETGKGPGVVLCQENLWGECSNAGKGRFSCRRRLYRFSS